MALDQGEGVYIEGASYKILNQSHWFKLDFVKGNLEAENLVPAPDNGLVKLTSEMVAYRYSDSKAKDNAVRYVLDDLMFDGDRPKLVVSSTAFDGTDADKAILNRIRQPDPKVSDQCIESNLALSNAKENRFASLFPPEPTPGPTYHCQSGIGFVVEQGETILRPWKSLGREWTGPSYLRRDGVAIKLESPEVNLQKVDLSDANEHPIGLLHKSEITYYPSRGVGPPYAAPGVREDGSWLIGLGAQRFRKLEISFPASDKTPIGFRFLERLHLVDANDPRCQHNQ